MTRASLPVGLPTTADLSGQNPIHTDATPTHALLIEIKPCAYR